MTELTDNDKQRIEQEAIKLAQYMGGVNSTRKLAFIAGAEYATRWERDRVELLEGTIRTMIKEHSKNTDRLVGEIEELEAERTELIGKLQARLERCRKVSGYSSGFSDIHNEIDFLDLLLNSLQK